KRDQGIGERVIQFTSIALIIPAIVILGLEEVIQKETVAALLSGLGGYGLSSATTGGRKPPPSDPKSPVIPKPPEGPLATSTSGPYAVVEAFTP
ncbi:MAG TPA: hypothetical protein PKC54_08835, partial [Ferruginibacter sp.]|nr:hypothetical protein [Ferruginibacter sp.]